MQEVLDTYLPMDSFIGSDTRNIDKNVRDLFHLGSAVFSDGYSIRPIWRLQHYKIDTKMGI